MGVSENGTALKSKFIIIFPIFSILLWPEKGSVRSSIAQGAISVEPEDWDESRLRPAGFGGLKRTTDAETLYSYN